MRVKITDFGTAKLLKKEEIKDGQPTDGLSSSARDSVAPSLTLLRRSQTCQEAGLVRGRSSARPSMSARRS